MIFESRYVRRIRLRIDGIEDELGRSLSIDEIIQEFKRQGYKRPFCKVVEGILQERGKGVTYYKP